MPLRLLISSASSGPANFTCPVNPSFFDPADRPNVRKHDVLFGPNVWQKPAFDSELRTLRWERHEVSSGNAMDQVVDYFRSIEGQVRYFNFQDMNPLNERWDTANAIDDNWKKARVIEIKPTYQKGGKLKYNTVDLLIQPEI